MLEIEVVRCQGVPAFCRASPVRRGPGWGPPVPPLPVPAPRPRSQKADRAALAGKVSCAQFDAAVEQLNKTIEDTLSKVTGQEQGWHRVQQKLVEELGSKVQAGSSPPRKAGTPGASHPPLHAESTQLSWAAPPGFPHPSVAPVAPALCHRWQLAEALCHPQLDRLELAPLRQQLEERCRSILRQLEERAPQAEADDAAGIRK